ncbi:MAG: hypothetical protein SAL07_11270 [Oscillatoria sp. PMC 1051.18]|nr:hypothetical protein [Oscillatoria sp. PMC 1050.18]MEC5030486.1 hypothetical protein [Oscillatoria sp. PMC 1051.18]
METLTATALVTLFLTKMVEKVGENLGEKLPELGDKVLEQMGKLKQLLWRKVPDTASAIERVTYQPELVEQEPNEYGIDVLTRKLEAAAKTDSEIAEVVNVIDAEIRPQLSQEVEQVMASGIKAKGSLKAEKMTQEAKKASSVRQKMLTDVEVGEDIVISDLNQRA